MINFVNTKKDDGTKLLANKDELLNNKNLKEGNIAVVYNNTLKNIQHGELLQYINFPETVTLPKPLSETLQMQVSVPALLEPATDEPIQTSAFYISTQTVSFSYLFEDSTAISVMYVSTDTQHFTRTRFEKINAETNEVIESLKNPVDLSKEVKVMTSEIADLMAGGDANLVDDVNTCLYFAQTGGEEFGGVYKCNLVDGQLKYELLADDINNYIDDTFDKTSTSSSQNGVASLVKKLDAVNMNNVTLLSYFFSGCSNLESIGEIQNMGNATNISYMFSDCTNLIQIPNLDTSNATDMSGMFYKCSSLTTIPTLNTSNVKQIASMFQGCTSLTSLPITNLGNATNISGICRDCSSLTEIPQFDTSKVTEFRNAFLGCSSITSLPLFNTSSVTNMGSAFSNCSNLTEIPQFDTSNVTNMSNMFNGDTNLVTIPILNTSKATCNNMIENCPNLSDESLNNVLYMLANSATSSSYKTLKRAGFSNEQATTCTTLSNWAACEEAGWITGY